jgi:hypothetical protein
MSDGAQPRLSAEEFEARYPGVRPPVSQTDAQARGLPWQPYGYCTDEALAILTAVKAAGERHEAAEPEGFDPTLTAKIENLALRDRITKFVVKLRAQAQFSSSAYVGAKVIQIADDLEKLLDG